MSGLLKGILFDLDGVFYVGNQLIPKTVKTLNWVNENDVDGAQASRIKGVLIKTGKFIEEVIDSSSVKPYMIIDSIANLPKSVI